jgi:hypothetical protein
MTPMEEVDAEFYCRSNVKSSSRIAKVFVAINSPKIDITKSINKDHFFAKSKIGDKTNISNLILTGERENKCKKDVTPHKFLLTQNPNTLKELELYIPGITTENGKCVIDSRLDEVSYFDEWAELKIKRDLDRMKQMGIVM